MPIPGPCPRHRRRGQRRGFPRAPRRVPWSPPALAAPPSELRKQSVTKAPPEEPRSRRRIPRLRKHATNLMWALLAAARPMGVVPGARPRVRHAAGRAGDPGPGRGRVRRHGHLPHGRAKAVDAHRRRVRRRVRMGDDLRSPRRHARTRSRSARCGSRSLAVNGTRRSTPSLKSVAGLKADLLVVVEPSKKVRNALVRTDRYPFTLTSGQVVVLSSAPVRELPLPKPLPSDLIVRLQVDRPEGRVHRVRRPRRGLAPRIDVERPAQGASAARRRQRGTACRSSSPETSGSPIVPPSIALFDATFRDAMRADANAQNTAATFPWSLMFVPDRLRPDVAAHGARRRRGRSTWPARRPTASSHRSDPAAADQADSRAMIASATWSVVAAGADRRRSIGDRR